MKERYPAQLQYNELWWKMHKDSVVCKNILQTLHYLYAN